MKKKKRLVKPVILSPPEKVWPLKPFAPNPCGFMPPKDKP